MVRDSLKSLLDMFPWFLDKNISSNFYKSQNVSNNQFKKIYNDLNNIYHSFNLNKKCLIWRVQNEPYKYTVNFIANYPHLKNVTLYKNNEVIYTESYLSENNISSFNYSYVHNTSNDIEIETSNDSEEENPENINEPDIIPQDNFKIIIETFDEYTIMKGYPENDTIQNNVHDHDISLNEIGALYNLPRKDYQPVTEEEYFLTEPPFNDKLTEDDYHYMKRIINYIILTHTVPLPVAEIYKIYGLTTVMENRSRYLLKVFDIFQHPHYYDDSVDENEDYFCDGDRLFVNEWIPREWEHKDKFYDYQLEHGAYFFTRINTKLPSPNQKIRLSFRFLNNLAEELIGDYLVDIQLNDTNIISNFRGNNYPPEGSEENYPYIHELLNPSKDNVLKVTGKNIDGEIIGVTHITIRVKGCGTGDYYVNPIMGDDNNDGTMNFPFLTLNKALSKVTSNKNIVVLTTGEHTIDSTINLNKNVTLMGCSNTEHGVIINSPSNQFFKLSSGVEFNLQNIVLNNNENTQHITSNTYTNNNFNHPMYIETENNQKILFNPLFDGSENMIIQGYNSNAYNVYNNVGVLKGACFSEGWDNTGLWELSVDVAYLTGLRYVGLILLTSPDNPFNGWGIFGWEGSVTSNPRLDNNGTPNYTKTPDSNLNDLTGSIWSNPTVDWYTLHMKKTSSTTLEVWKNNNIEDKVVYEWLELSDKPIVTMGASTNMANLASQELFGSIYLKNLIVTKI